MKFLMRAGQGSDEANHGGERYRVANDGTALVDEAAVPHLQKTGGYTLVDTAPPIAAASGEIKMIHSSDPAARCTFAGVPYAPDSEGVLTVPIQATSHLLAHGFIVAPKAPPA